MRDLKVMIFGVAAALLASMALIAALDAYVAQVHAQASGKVIRLETVTVTARRPAPPTRSVEAGQAASPAKRL